MKTKIKYRYVRFQDAFDGSWVMLDLESVTMVKPCKSWWVVIVGGGHCLNLDKRQHARFMGYMKRRHLVA